MTSRRIPGMRIPGMRIPGMRIPGMRILGMRIPVMRILGMLLACVVWAAPARAERPQLWMNVMEPVWRDIKGWPPSDFARLAAEDQWPGVLAGLGVFQFTEKYAAHGDPAELGALLALLKRHHVRIAIQGIALLATTGCGLGIEGYGTADETLVSARRLAQLGGQVDAVVFDEPLYFGHFFTGRGPRHGCQLPVAEIARQLAQRAQALRAAFPGLQVGDVEPFGLTDVTPSAWQDAYTQFLDSSLPDHALDFVQADIVWERAGWRQQFLASLAQVTRHKLLYGVLVTASPPASSNAAWASEVAANLRQFEALGTPPPQQVVFASWTDYPRALLPERDPATMTAALLAYLAHHP